MNQPKQTARSSTFQLTDQRTAGPMCLHRCFRAQGLLEIDTKNWRSAIIVHRVVQHPPPRIRTHAHTTRAHTHTPEPPLIPSIAHAHKCLHARAHPVRSTPCIQCSPSQRTPAGLIRAPPKTRHSVRTRVRTRDRNTYHRQRRTYATRPDAPALVDLPTCV